MKLRNDVTLRKVGSEHIIVEPSQGMVDLSTVFTLNDTAAFLWKELDGREFDNDTVVDLLIGNYEVEREVAEKDAAALLQHFRGQGLIVD